MKFEVQNGCFAYPGGRPLLQNISFGVEAPRILAVLGPNGAGKSTLLRCMLGLLPWQQGQTLLDGHPLAALNKNELWKTVGYVPQQKRAPLSCTALEMVLLGRSAHLGLLAQPGKKDEAIARECLEKAGIPHLANRPCGSLSGGEYQLVLFARALAVQPRFLVLDEPEASLDFKNQQLVLETMARLCKEEGLGAVWITHSPQNALALADDALLLNREGAYRFGPAGATLTAPALEWALEVPVHLSRVEAAGQSAWCVLPLGQQTKE